jgi:hypothetical protein
MVTVQAGLIFFVAFLITKICCVRQQQKFICLAQERIIHSLLLIVGPFQIRWLKVNFPVMEKGFSSAHTMRYNRKYNYSGREKFSAIY